VSDLVTRILRDVGRAVSDHKLIEAGDKVMVAVSGGKDSYAMLDVLRRLQRRAPVRFELLAVHLDQAQPGYDGAPLRAWLEREGHPHEILREDTYSIVVDRVPEGNTYCALCSRLRRGILYSAATRLGCNKIALGHHRDDAIETLLLNLFFSGRIAAMPARLVSDDGAHVVIRPMINCAEETLAAYAVEQAFPILPCNLCGSQENAQRKQMKALLARMESEHAGVKSSVFAALGNVRPTQLLDRGLLGRSDEPRRGAPDAGEAPGVSLGGGRLRVLGE
jgi:tRNA 2-thiocytidine biosynthesis protein TtcA